MTVLHKNYADHPQATVENPNAAARLVLHFADFAHVPGVARRGDEQGWYEKALAQANPHDGGSWRGFVADAEAFAAFSDPARNSLGGVLQEISKRVTKARLNSGQLADAEMDAYVRLPSGQYRWVEVKAGNAGERLTKDVDQLEREAAGVRQRLLPDQLDGALDWLIGGDATEDFLAAARDIAASYGVRIRILARNGEVVHSFGM